NRDSGLGAPHSLTVLPGTPIRQDTPHVQPRVSGGGAAALRTDQTLGTPNRSQEWETLSSSPVNLLSGHGGALSCGSISRSSFEGQQNTSSHFLPLEPKSDVDSCSSSSSSRRAGWREQATRAEWDRAVSRIVQLLSDQPSSLRPGEEADASVSLLIAQLLSQSSQWMDAGSSAGSSPASERQQNDAAGGSRVRSPAPQVVKQDFLHRKQDGSAGILRTEAPLLTQTTANGTLESSVTLQGSQLLGLPEALLSAGRTLAESEPLWASEASLEQLRAEHSDLLQDTGAMLSDSSHVTMLDSAIMSFVVEDPGLTSPLLKDSHSEPSHQELCSVRTLEAPDPEQQRKEISLPVWERIMEAGSGRGILEEPDLTLLSLADSTAEQEEPSAVQREGSETLGGGCESHKGEDNVSSEDKKSGECASPGGTDRNSGDETVASRAETAGLCPEVSSEAGASEGPEKGGSVPASFPAWERCTGPKGVTKGPVAELKKVGEVKVCAAEQRKMEEAEMYQRTERLYNQLEEVRQRKEMRTRQESYTRNREKAKEFQ
ncbi:hypothetical protein Z043_109075, partial [Scleropages formosus]